MDGTILVVDDDEAMAKLIVAAAANIGLRGSILTDPTHLAEHLAGSGDPDVLALDLKIPGRDGVEILRELGRRRVKSRVLIVSGLDEKTIATAERVGAGYGLTMLAPIRKPFRVEQLREALRRGAPELRPMAAPEVEAAITEHRLFLEFQPKVALTTPPRLAGAEALARINHPTQGVLTPASFVPMLERSGRLLDVTCGVLREAAGQRRAWAMTGRDVTVTVGIPPAVMKELTIPDQFEAIVLREDGRPDDFVLELSETGVMADLPTSMDVLTRLRVKGFGLSLDYFGTANASLAQLHSLPFSELKVDRSFIAQVNASRHATTIVKGIIDLGHNLELLVCAEGVEDKATHDTLVALGCDMAQGLFYGQPMAAKVPPSSWLVRS